MVAAIIAGGNVTVPTGKTVGATFQHLPLCTSANQSGCVIAYSSFPSEPPSDSMFGRPGQGISLNSGQTATTGVQVACVNPADIGGGTADMSTYWPVRAPLPMPSMAPPAPAVHTPWLSYPQQYTGTCETEGGATWLQVTPVAAAGDTRPRRKRGRRTHMGLSLPGHQSVLGQPGERRAYGGGCLQLVGRIRVSNSDCPRSPSGCVSERPETRLVPGRKKTKGGPTYT